MDKRKAKMSSKTEPSEDPSTARSKADSLHEAVMASDTERVKALLALGVNVNVRADTSESVLQIAAGHGHVEVVELLLAHGADVNARDWPTGGALQLASENGHEKIVKLLLDHGADVGSALQDASRNGHDTIVKLLLDHGAYVGCALQDASRNGHDTIVKLLLDHGADVNAGDELYDSALVHASRNGHEGIVKLLLGRGADTRAQGRLNGNALQAASYGGFIEIVKLLLDHGADVNAQGGLYGNALQAASYGGLIEIVKLLVDHGADFYAQNEPYGNALQAASYGGSDEIVKLLLKKGADINAKGGRFRTAIEAALQARQVSTIQLLLDQGAEVVAEVERLPGRVTGQIPLGASALDVEQDTSTPADILSLIKSEILDTSRSINEIYCVRVYAELEPFVQEETNGFEDLSTVLTLNGHNSCAYAATCSSYVTKFWPHNGLTNFEMIKRALSKKHSFETANLGKTTDIYYSRDIRRGHSRFVIYHYQDPQELIDYVQILAWMCAQFRLPTGSGFAYSDIMFTVRSPSDCELRLLPLEIIPSTDYLCWNNMVGTGILAKRFPVPPRQRDQVGLELPFDIMISLAGILYPIRYRDSLVLKGFSTALIPVARPSSDSIQWHFERAACFSEDIMPIAVSDLVGGARDKDFVQICYPELGNSVAFVGIWSEAEVRLGTEGSIYQDFQPTGVKSEMGSWGMEHEHQFTFGISKIFNAQVNFKLRRSEALSVQDNFPPVSFDDHLNRSAGHPLLLYDTSTNCAWLIPELSLVLHLAILMLKLDGISVPTPYARMSADGGRAALEAIKSYRCGTVDLESTIQKIFTMFANRRDEVLKKNDENTKKFGWSRSRLLGWELDEIQNPQYLALRKQVQIKPDDTGGWHRILKTRPDILVLFGSGLVSSMGEPVKPTEIQNLCIDCCSLRPHKYLMLASVLCLDKVNRRYGQDDVEDNRYRVTAKHHLTISSTQSKTCGGHLLRLSRTRSDKPAELTFRNGAVCIGKHQIQCNWVDRATTSQTQVDGSVTPSGAPRNGRTSPSLSSSSQGSSEMVVVSPVNSGPTASRTSSKARLVRKPAFMNLRAFCENNSDQPQSLYDDEQEWSAN